MEFERLSIEGLVVIKPKIWGDDRGFFYESYSKKVFKENGVDLEFIQDNHSFSSKGVLRGLHFQTEPNALDKLVRVIDGEVLDVAVDLRKNSPTFGKWHAVKLSGENKFMFLIPKGFAHGFVTLSDTAHFLYKQTGYYSPENDKGLLWNDPEVGVEWNVQNPQLSEKDKVQPTLKQLVEKGLAF